MQFNSELLKSLRREKKWSRRELAERAGVGEHTIWKIEAGITKSPQLHIVNALASTLGIEPSVFFGLTTYRRKRRA